MCLLLQQFTFQYGYFIVNIKQIIKALAKSNLHSNMVIL